MLDVDTFLTTLYGLVDEWDKTALPPEPPTTGPASALSRSEVLTLALFGQWSQFPSERAFYRYAERYVRPAFPTLPDPARAQPVESPRASGRSPPDRSRAVGRRTAAGDPDHHRAHRGN